jgi:hypothetical protein
VSDHDEIKYCIEQLKYARQWVEGFREGRGLRQQFMWEDGLRRAQIALARFHAAESDNG